MNLKMTCRSSFLLPLVLMLPFWGTVTALGPLLAYEVDLNRVTGLAVLLLLALASLRTVPALSHSLLLLVASIVVGHALGDGDDPHGLSQSILYLSAVMLFVYVADSTNELWRQITLFVALKILALLVTLILCLLAVQGSGINLVANPPVFLHTRLLGMSAFYALVLLLVVVAHASSTKARPRMALILILGTSMLVGYFTAWFAARGSLVALILFLATAWIFVPQHRGITSVTTFALIAGMVLCLMVGETDYLARRLSRNHQDFNSVTSGRWMIWKECFDWWISSPRNLLFGAGPDAFRLEAWTGRDNRAIQPHNVIVQIALEWGAIGLGVATMLLSILLRRVISLLRTASSAGWQKIVACSIPALITYALVDGIFYHAVSILPAAILFGLLFGATNRKVEQVNLLPDH